MNLVDDDRKQNKNGRTRKPNKQQQKKKINNRKGVTERRYRYYMSITSNELNQNSILV